MSDVDDARRVADRLGIEHHVFNFGDDFERDVVAPYVADHAAGRTPNPCIECNRHLKFDRLLDRAELLGFRTIATGHHAQIVETASGRRLGRGADRAKDQSYVLHMLGPDVLDRLLLPLGHLTKTEVRRIAADLDMRTAHKPESQDVCFITNEHGRRDFLGHRIPLRPARVVDEEGAEVGAVESVELVTIGQRKGLGLPGGTDPRYVIDVSVTPEDAVVTVGERASLSTAMTPLESWTWWDDRAGTEVLAQCAAHGIAEPAVIVDGEVRWAEPHRRIAAGQSVVAYVDDRVVGGGIAG